MNRIPFGVVGAEFAREIISSRLAGRYAGVAAVYDSDERLLTKLEPELGKLGAYCFRDYKRFLSCGIKAVIIGKAPNGADLSVKALRKGLDVLSEPPMALTVGDINRIERAAAESGRFYSLALYSCHKRENLLAAELYRRGDIGRLVYAEGDEFVSPLPEIPVGLMSAGSVGKVICATKLRVADASYSENSQRDIKIGVGLLRLSNESILRALCGNFGVSERMRLVGESGIIETSPGKLVFTDNSGIVPKSTLMRPEGFELPGMIKGADFAKSSAIAGFAAKLRGDQDAATRCVDFLRAKEISFAVTRAVGFEKPDSAPLYGYNVERKK